MLAASFHLDKIATPNTNPNKVDLTSLVGYALMDSYQGQVVQVSILIFTNAFNLVTSLLPISDMIDAVLTVPFVFAPILSLVIAMNNYIKFPFNRPCPIIIRKYSFYTIVLSIQDFQIRNAL